MAFHSDSDSPRLAELTRTVQVILGAMVTGLLLFAVVDLVILTNPVAEVAPPLFGFFPPLTTLSIVAGGIGLIGSWLVPDLYASAHRRKLAGGTRGSTDDRMKDDREALGQLFVTTTLVGAALVEGAAFFAMVAHLIERQRVALGIALALTASLAVRIPSRERVRQWVDAQLDALNQDRQFDQ